MKINEVWTKVKSVEVDFTGVAVVFTFRTEPCAQHCLSYFKANPAFVVCGSSSDWIC